MPDQSNLPEGVELLRDVKLCADCGQPVTHGDGHIHGRFSPVRFVPAVRYSDLPAIEEQARQEERERLLGEKARGVVADFLSAWQFCPVSQASDAARSCLDDAASQLLDALDPDTTEGGSQ